MGDWRKIGEQVSSSDGGGGCIRSDEGNLPCKKVVTQIISSFSSSPDITFSNRQDILVFSSLFRPCLTFYLQKKNPISLNFLMSRAEV